MVVGSCGRGEGSAFPVLWASHKGLLSRPTAAEESWGIAGDKSCLLSAGSGWFCSVSVQQEIC